MNQLIQTVLNDKFMNQTDSLL